ncbi:MULTISPECIES: MerR family transcriptional regulator [Burkholderia]|uniref:MerR family transcriptional regulator n=1 Tax=Burkholderia gladioli TaxID=28095 RepID=A0A2A7S3T0_BURGA|nr:MULTISPECIES: MerR family transcriptional regulator [Burkholderia]ATF84031.1 MerR family transcriptional regulator [Burkholderia gladioli pv. gladioli]MBJ9661587.1 MerR family transcriptional regulator [Burkholderia gladioli]MBJ9710107.1 MerR family transcriptional regulator [Burkholderia gladioli]MBU9154542.1 MerR family transcriptional regulator [Burkholderia gladioli]MBU9197116.1 MerR family transcriptional regulator [Burkholderia gladioli]
MPRPSDPSLLTVRDAAERLGVTPRTLKYYEERGLVTPSRSEGRYRLYDEADLDRFSRILRLRAIGFSLHGITEMLKRPLEPAAESGGRRRYSENSLRDIHTELTAQVARLDERIAAARRELREVEMVRAELRHDLDYIERRIAGDNPDELIAKRQAAAKQAKPTQAAQPERRARSHSGKPRP